MVPKNPPSRHSLPKTLRTGLALVLSALFLYLAARGVALGEVWSVLSRANAGLVALALGSVFVNSLAKTFRWRLFIGPSGRRVGLGRLFLALSAGQMANTFFPGRFGDLGRAWVVGGMGPGRSFVLGTVVLEKLLDMVAYALLALALIILLPLPDWIGNSAYAVVGVAAGVTVLLVLLILCPARSESFINRIVAWLPARLRLIVAPRLRSGLMSLSAFQNRRGLAGLAGWTVVVWGTALLNNHLTLRALSLPLPWTASLLILIALQAGISLSSVPGTIGVFEYLCVLSLSVFGVDRATALGYGVLLHGIVLLPVVLAGIAAFWSLHLTREDTVSPVE